MPLKRKKPEKSTPGTAKPRTTKPRTTGNVSSTKGNGTTKKRATGGTGGQRRASRKKKNPGRTPEDEFDERVRMTVQLLSAGLYTSEIKKAIKDKYQVDARTVENYLSRARDILLLELREDRDVHKSQSLAFYRSILRNPEAKLHEKIAAQKRIDHILGLHSPSRVAFTDTLGNDIDRDAAADRVASLAARFAERFGIEGVGELPDRIGTGPEEGGVGEEGPAGA
jgi:hypothetical protein